MNLVKNGIESINGSSIERDTNFPIDYVLKGDFLKHISTDLFCTKYEEVNICHSDE